MFEKFDDNRYTKFKEGIRMSENQKDIVQMECRVFLMAQKK